MATRRQILTSLPATGAAFALGGALLGEGPAAAQTPRPTLPGHFHPKGKAPSPHTIRVIDDAKATLPFADTRDFKAFNTAVAVNSVLETLVNEYVVKTLEFHCQSMW